MRLGLPGLTMPAAALLITLAAGFVFPSGVRADKTIDAPPEPKVSGASGVIAPKPVETPGASDPKPAILGKKVSAGSPIGPGAGKTRRKPPARPASATRAVSITVQVVPLPPTVGGRYEIAMAAPNPFSTSIRIAYVCPRRALVSLQVYDISGHRVAELAHGVNDPGRYTIQWNGVDEQGRRLRAGVYAARLDVGDWSTSKKIVLAR